MAVFVFGSNLAGRHRKGAAKYALENCGAVYGQGEGMQGRSYAIPTKTENLGAMDWSEIDLSVARFLAYARATPYEDFHLTPVGCGLAGHNCANLLASLRKHGTPPNVLLTSSWVQSMETYRRPFFGSGP